MSKRALLSALNRAASYGIGSARDHAVTSPEDGMRFVMSQIAGTLLARRLVFTVEGQNAIECDVASGRLLRFSECGAESETLVSGSFDGDAEACANNALLEEFSTLLSRIFSGASRVSLQSLPIDNTARSGGIPALKVAELLGFGPRPVPAAQWFRNFVECNETAIVSAAYLEGDLLYPLVGDNESVDGLLEKVECLLPNIGCLPNCDANKEDFLITLEPDQDTILGLALLARGSSILIASVAPNALATTARSWLGVQSQ